MTDSGAFDAVAARVRTSVLFRAADAVASAGLVAIDRSALTARVRAARVRFAALTSAGRLQAVAIVVATASLGHLLMLPLLPAQIAPATPKTLWMLVAAAALVVALCARQVAASWKTSVVSRVVEPIVRSVRL